MDALHQIRSLRKGAMHHFMPGGKKDYDRVLIALKEGRPSREQLEVNGLRVLKVIDRLRQSPG